MDLYGAHRRATKNAVAYKIGEKGKCFVYCGALKHVNKTEALGFLKRKINTFIRNLQINRKKNL